MTSAFLSPAQVKRSTGMDVSVDVDWREIYLGSDILRFVRLASENSSGKSIPYSGWQWRSLDAPGHRQDGPWILEHARLRRHMEMDGIVVLVGPPRAGKSCLLERLPVKIIENSRSGQTVPAPLALADLPPSGLFAIDETARHDPIDVLRVLDHPTVRNRGCALVFQSAASFRNYEIWPLFAERNVLIQELIR